ncbi:hypothetical protein FIBSPDRAFT_940854 [Athelia psychrophila]|uniref:Uncharacterized protein n=1 Tax=Athelia psychrophila TaxID=1759441 RepID=A0A167V6P3_9AGAM|nr:hypothetical protein FIBSPDRAFT_940854 [Fibularhizoctonia sp. CBS 109695]
MRHLLVTELEDFGYFEDFEENLVVLAQSFPDIEQLTIQNGQHMDDVFKAILCGDSEDSADGGRVVVQWPKLQTIAVSACIEDFDASKLQNLILRSQRAGRPIRKLLLPQTVIAGEGADALVELGKLVEMDEFNIDWPTPFDWSKEPELPGGWGILSSGPSANTFIFGKTPHSISKWLQ